MPADLHRIRLGAFVIAVAAFMAVALTGCNAGAPASPSTGAATPLKVGLGYIPSVQFAPFYLADQQGYYRDAGLTVTFQNGQDADIIPLVGQGGLDIGIADGTSVIPAVGQSIPVRYAATLYARFPNIVFAKDTAGISTAADLAGKKLGIPVKGGSSWVMLQALLASAGLSPADLQIVEFPDYGQGVAVRQGVVDAATGYVNNEVVQLQLAGVKAVVLTVDAITPLPGPGLITSAATLAGPKHDAVKAFVAATLRAMREIIADPQKGLDAAVVAVPTLGADRPTQLAILDATIGAWQSPYTDQHGLGAIDTTAWAKSIDFIRTTLDSPLTSTVTADQMTTQELLP
ncbi:MAG: ABC transporter substrate-binding protein [Candidatus Limnocylindrales bacterium]